MDSSAVATILGAKLGEAKADKQAIEDKITATRQKIANARQRLPKAARDGEESLQSEISRLEFYRSTNSMSLSKEKAILRQQDQAKAKIKSLKDRAKQQEDIQALSDTHTRLVEESRAQSEKISELSKGLAKVNLAIKAGVPVESLATITVTIPHEKIGVVLGKGRASLTALEREHSVACGDPVDAPEGSDTAGTATIDISGAAAAVEAAAARIRNVAGAVEERTPLAVDLAAALRANKCALREALAAQCGLVLLLRSGGAAPPPAAAAAAAAAGGRKEGAAAAAAAGGKRRGGGAEAAEGEVLLSKGLPEAQTLLHERLAALKCSHEVIPIQETDMPAILGAKGSTLRSVEDEFNVVIDIDRGHWHLTVRGQEAGVGGATEQMRTIIGDNRLCEEFVSLDDKPYMVGFLLAHQAPIIKGVQKEAGSGVSITVQRPPHQRPYNGNAAAAAPVPPAQRAGVKLRGPAARVAKALPLLQQAIAAADERVVRIVMEPLQLRAVIGKGGATVNKLRSKCPCVEVHADWDLSTVRLFSTEEGESGAAALATARAMVEDVIVNNFTKEIHIGKEAARQLLHRDSAALMQRINAPRAGATPASLNGKAEAEATPAATEGAGDEGEGSGNGAGKAAAHAMVEGLGVSVDVPFGDPQGLVRLRGERGAIDQAVELLEAFKEENYVGEMMINADDGPYFTTKVAPAIGKHTGAHLHLTRDYRAPPRNGTAAVTTNGHSDAAAATNGGTAAPPRNGRSGAKHSGDGSRNGTAEEGAGGAQNGNGRRDRRAEAEAAPRLVTVRGRKDAVDAALAQAKAALEGGWCEGLRQHVEVVSFEPEVMGFIVGRQGATVRKLEADLGVLLAVHSWRHTVRITGPSADTVSAARQKLRAFAAGVRITAAVPLPHTPAEGKGRKGAAAAGAGAAPQPGVGASLRSVSQEFDVAADVRGGEVVLRGGVQQVSLARLHMRAMLGVGGITIQLSEGHATRIADTNTRRIATTHSVTMAVDMGNSAIVITGAWPNIDKAKRDTYSMLEFVFPGQYATIELPRPALFCVASAPTLDSIATATGAALALDPPCCCIRARGEPQAVDAAAAAVAVALEGWGETNAMLPVEAWMLPLVTGRRAAEFLGPRRAPVPEEQSEEGSEEGSVEPAASEEGEGEKGGAGESEGEEGAAVGAGNGQQEKRARKKPRAPIVAEVRLDTRALQLHIGGATPADVARVHAELAQQLASLSAEHAEVTLPPASLSKLIGKAGASIRALQTDTGARVHIADDVCGRVTLDGPAASVTKAKEALAAFAREWAAENACAEMDVPERLMRVVIGARGAGVRALSEACGGVRIDCDRGSGVVRVRGPDVHVEAAVAKLREIVDADCAARGEAQAQAQAQARATQQAKGAAAAAATAAAEQPAGAAAAEHKGQAEQEVEPEAEREDSDDSGAGSEQEQEEAAAVVEEEETSADEVDTHEEPAAEPQQLLPQPPATKPAAAPPAAPAPAAPAQPATPQPSAAAALTDLLLFGKKFEPGAGGANGAAAAQAPPPAAAPAWAAAAAPAPCAPSATIRGGVTFADLLRGGGAGRGGGGATRTA